MTGAVKGNSPTINTFPDEGYEEMVSTPIAYKTYDLTPIIGREFSFRSTMRDILNMNPITSKQLRLK